MSQLVQINSQMSGAWKAFLDSLEKSIDMLEQELDSVAEQKFKCNQEWCESAEDTLDEISNSLFAVSEPRWAEEEETKQLRRLKKRVYKLYSSYQHLADKGIFSH